MSKLNFLFLLFIFAFSVHSVRSQFCGEEIKFSLINDKGKPLLNNKIKIKELTDYGYNRIYFDKGKPTENTTRFKIGCTSGGIVSVIYKGSEMKISFKFGSNASSAEGKITFQKGSFIAEPEKAEFGKFPGIQIRKAKDEELK